MKNIYILPTDKPSRVYKHLGRELKYTARYFEQKGFLCVNQNMYITSDEEIKDGWVWHLGRGHLLKVGQFTEINGNKGFRDTEFILNGIEVLVKDCKKVVLTTDQSLDGVQAIPDNFLEWFVKNPSCEEVKVEYGCCGQCDERLCEVFDLGLKQGLYKIIIPKEETLEEAISKELATFKQSMEPHLIKRNINFIQGANFGAKWQQESSKQDLKDLWDYVNERCLNHLDDEAPQLGTFNEWFNQFKKR